MFQKKEFSTLVLPTGKYYFIIFLVILISLSIAAFFVFLGLKYGLLWVAIIGAVLSAAVPAIFVRLKINFIAKKVTINFSEDFFEIKTSGVLDNRVNYSDIKYFSVSKYNVDNASIIKYILRNGIKRRYIFFRQFNNDENVLNNVLLYFSSFNIGKIPEERIQIYPSFFLTKLGRIFVAVTGLIILAAIIIQVVYRPKTIPASLIAVLGGYLQVKGIQMKDKKILEKFRDENLSYSN